MDGKWQTVSDKEAAWKVSQALREKARWRSPVPSTVAVAASDDIKTPNDSATKRSAVDAGVVQLHGTMYPPKQKVKSEARAAKLAQPHVISEHTVPVPTDVAHIAVPPIIGIEESKMVAMLPPNSDPGSIDFYPRDGDVLFGECIFLL